MPEECGRGDLAKNPGCAVSLYHQHQPQKLSQSPAYYIYLVKGKPSHSRSNECLDSSESTEVGVDWGVMLLSAHWLLVGHSFCCCLVLSFIVWSYCCFWEAFCQKWDYVREVPGCTLSPLLFNWGPRHILTTHCSSQSWERTHSLSILWNIWSMQRVVP